ncbi:uncharacterized protein LOC132729100 [Ruditapes philippinarum]|uniref:uncharacterized protein LOC132729100 n=1 Tax=Ruditapes philippinarum TaxID=129788 RepID=UPI00295AFAD4|nr:uncharacterized protein LOC132729100 [Ruditapes philippinarum]
MQTLGNGALYCKRTKKTVLNGKMHKQIAHCNVERRRRGLINERMVKLQGLLFPGSTKCQKSDVLKKAIDCISRMKEDYDRIRKVEEAVVKVREENKVLASQVQVKYRIKHNNNRKVKSLQESKRRQKKIYAKRITKKQKEK